MTRQRPVAVVDIGSNSARVVVYGLDQAGQLRILASARAALRLVREVDASGRLGDEAVARTLEALRDFRAMALGAGARKIVTVATAAMRDAEDGAALIQRVKRELGLEIQIIDGEQEAVHGFAGALRGMPVDGGIVFDQGGGSMQVSVFRQRGLVRSWSFPLGALRLSRKFLRKDPPAEREMQRLRQYTRDLLEAARLPVLQGGDELVGTGGTLRNLAKVDRRGRGYPLTRLHGYALSRKRLGEIVDELATRREQKRNEVPGLSDERSDSIVGGALGIETLMDVVGARRVLVSGQGVREGLALSLLAGPMPAVLEERRASIASLTSRFAGWDEDSARRRSAVAATLLRALDRGVSEEVAEALGHAATVLDVGRTVDFFDRHQHVADIVTETDLLGFSHRQIALLSAILRVAGDEDSDLTRYRPLVRDEDHEPIARAAAVMVLADDIEERSPPGAPIGLTCSSERHEMRVRVSGLLGWRARGLGQRFERVFGRKLTVIPVGSGAPGRSTRRS